MPRETTRTARLHPGKPPASYFISLSLSFSSVPRGSRHRSQGSECEVPSAAPGTQQRTSQCNPEYRRCCYCYGKRLLLTSSPRSLQGVSPSSTRAKNTHSPRGERRNCFGVFLDPWRASNDERKPWRDRTGHKNLGPQFSFSSMRLQTEGKACVLEDGCCGRKAAPHCTICKHKVCRSPSVSGTQGVSSGHAAPHGRPTPTGTSEEGQGPGRKYTGSCLCFEK